MMNDGNDDKLSADIRRLMGEAPTPSAPAAEEPLLLTDPIETAPPAVPTKADRAISAALAKLDAREAERAAGAEPGLTVSNRSLDALVQEALRPVLTEWLDRNLDRIVREQVDAALRAETERG